LGFEKVVAQLLDSGEVAFDGGDVEVVFAEFGLHNQKHPFRRRLSLVEAFGQPLDDFPGLTASVCNLRPESRGSVAITSPDPHDAPRIAPNYLSTSGDRQVAVAAIRQARAIMAQGPMQRYSPDEMKPGIASDNEADLVRAAGDIGTTIFHPTCTVHMGPDDTAPLDAQLRLRGVDGLRVVDASVMPVITSGNTNAPTIMIAEKASDLILEDARAT